MATMTPEAWTIVGVGVAMAALVSGLFYRLDVRINRLEDQRSLHGERLARLETSIDIVNLRKAEEQAGRFQGEVQRPVPHP